jgi:hypothetical protein
MGDGRESDVPQTGAGAGADRAFARDSQQSGPATAAASPAAHFVTTGTPRTLAECRRLALTKYAGQYICEGFDSDFHVAGCRGRFQSLAEALAHFAVHENGDFKYTQAERIKGVNV